MGYLGLMASSMALLDMISLIYSTYKLDVLEYCICGFHRYLDNVCLDRLERCVCFRLRAQQVQVALKSRR